MTTRLLLDPSTLATDPSPVVSRRSLLKGAGVAGVTVVVAGTGVLSYRGYDQAVLGPDHGHAFEAWRHWRSTPGPLGVVGAAILAANPHNTQPWVFEALGTSIDVYADRSRQTGALDALGRELHVGLGCALENLALAARARGFEPTVTLLPAGGTGDHVAHVELAPANAAPDRLYDAIGSRHSNRGPYRAQPVPPALLARLVDPTGLPGVGVHWLTGTAALAAMGELMIDAAVAITADPQQSRDSFGWFRSTDDAIQRHRDGLTLDGQGLSPLMLTAAKLLPASSRSSGDAFWVDQTRSVHTRTAAAYGVITVVDADDPTSRLLGGRLLQRVHLTATAEGLALQHMNQITERIDRERATQATATFAPRLARLLPAGVQPLAAFRVGHAARAARLSPRRSLAAVTR